MSREERLVTCINMLVMLIESMQIHLTKEGAPQDLTDNLNRIIDYARNTVNAD